MRGVRRGSLSTHWALALAVAVACGYIGVAALRSGGSDRPRGIVLSAVAACAAVALVRVRRARPDAVAKAILGICVVQAAAAVVMVAAHWGTPSVIDAVAAILIAAWSIPGVAFYAAARQDGV